MERSQANEKKLEQVGERLVKIETSLTHTTDAVEKLSKRVEEHISKVERAEHESAGFRGRIYGAVAAAMVIVPLVTALVLRFLLSGVLK